MRLASAFQESERHDRSLDDDCLFPFGFRSRNASECCCSVLLGDWAAHEHEGDEGRYSPFLPDFIRVHAVLLCEAAERAGGSLLQTP